MKSAINLTLKSFGVVLLSVFIQWVTSHIVVPMGVHMMYYKICDPHQNDIL